ncbi:MAG: thymidine kinase [Gammaproteobacteria bacterium]|nr:thymidine kinase [Gammaproteobacteria bacterium]
MAKLHFYYSAMNAGKSTTLLQSSHNYNERGMDTLLYTPKLDDRAGIGKIASRLGIKSEAISFDKFTDLLVDVKSKIAANQNIRCVLIDEAQFLSKEQVWQLCLIADELKVPVLAYGLRTDFRAETFEGSQYLLAWSDILIELKTICHCGRKAMMNMRIDEAGNAVREGAQIEIGGNDRYIAVCRQHFRSGQGAKAVKAAEAELVA